MSAKGVHIHHSAWGILTLIGVGYVWLLRLGTGGGSRWGSGATSLAYGAGTALTLDELDLWLLQQNKYWKGKGRANVGAVLLFGSLLSIMAAGSGFLRELLGVGSSKEEPGRAA